MPIQINGISGLGNINSMTDYNKIKDHVVFWRFRLELGEVNPSAGVYDWTSFEADGDTVIADGKYFSVEINNSPVATAPAYIFLPPYNVPKVTTSTGQSYPYYFNSNFIALKQAALDNLRNRIKNVWSAGRKNKLVFWKSSEGKTGDAQPYAGDVVSVTINGVVQPNPNAYDITDDAWTNYKRTSVWPQFYADLIADIPFCLLLINPDNDGNDWQWALTNIPTSGLKGGQPTHNYNNIGESFYAARGNALTAVIPINIFIGEFEQTDDAEWFQISTRQNTLALILSCITHGIVSMNIAPATFINIIDIDDPNDFWMFDFANNYMGVRDPSTTSKAFIALRDCLDGADMSRFDASYGTLIATADQAEYNSRYNNIITSGDPQTVQDDRITSLTAELLNDARRIAIDNAFPNLSFLTIVDSNDHDAYHQDGGVYMLKNYGKFITQYDPDNTSEGYARIGNVNQEHGRNCRATDTEMFFSIDSDIVSNNSYNVEFKIWYYDEGTRQWSFNYWNGTSKVNTGVFTNTNTNAWIEKTIPISIFYGGGNIDFTNDFSIKSEDGSKTKIEIISFERISQNTIGTSGVYILGNNSGTICGGTQVTRYTNGSFAIGKTLYSDVNLTTIVTGNTFLLNTADNTIYNLNTSTGVIGTSTGLTCTGSGVAGSYKLGNTLSTVCAAIAGTLYTNGSFTVGSILYTDAGLTTPQTGFTFVVRVATQIIYNLNTGTGVVGAATTGICGGGTLTVAKLGNDITTVCAQSTTNVYTNGVPAISKIVYTDINLTIPLTGTSYAVRNSNGKIYSLNTGTGAITGQVGVCNSGTPIDVILGNTIPDICNGSPTVVYASGNIATGIILYEDINLNTPVGGYNYVVAPDNKIYSLNYSTGEVIAFTNEICEGGVAANYIIGNDTVTICNTHTVTILYTDGSFDTGKTLYTDINLTTPLTTYQYAARLSTNFIYEINPSNGLIISNTNIKCNMALKTLTISRLRLQPTPNYNVKASIYWRYHLEETNTLVESNITVDPDGYFSPIITIPNLDSSRQYAVVTAVNEMCETIAEQYFLLQTNISCPEGFTLSEDQTYCYIIETTTATPPTSPENAVAATATAYGTCGSYIYAAGYNVNGTGTSAQITTSNPFWINWDGISAVCSDNNTSDGVLNRCGLWATTTTSNQDVGFGICINIPESKTYYIFLGCDNYGTIKLDGEIIVQQNEAALNAQYGIVGACFKVGHIYPVVIPAGLHIMEIIGHNTSSVASFGAEIYDNTSAEIISATSYGDLNLIFSTKDYIGAPIQLGTDGIGYSCPSGYSLNTCGSPITCTRIITVPPIIG